MADDFDVEALLEAPYKKEVNGEVSKSFVINPFFNFIDREFQQITNSKGFYEFY